MLSSRYKKENVIILPNKDKLPIGKIKDVNKCINMVCAEYGIEEDMIYFIIEKIKHSIIFKLQFIPRAVSEIHSINAKKFIVYELVKNSHGSVMKIDEDLNKRALVINDLLNTIDEKCKETITSKLQSMFDIPGELDYLLEQLLTDPQFNSFKYTVLDSSKTSCLLCVNSYGLFIRPLEPPYEVSKQLAWQDISAIKTKGNKLVFRKKSGEVDEIVCINKKTVLAAHSHLMKYLSFIGGERCASDNRRGKSSWFGSVALRIRQSFTRRPRVTCDSEPPTSAHSVPNKSTSSHYRENAPPNSTVPGSSVVSEDCMDNVGSMMEPSIKTNSTHDVSLGSTSSYKPGTSSLVRLSSPDDHVSVKTTSTYEVNLDTISSQPRTLSSGGGDSSRDPGPPVISTSQSQVARKSPPLSLLKDSVFSETMSSVDDVAAVETVVRTTEPEAVVEEVQESLAPLVTEETEVVRETGTVFEDDRVLRQSELELIVSDNEEIEEVVKSNGDDQMSECHCESLAVDNVQRLEPGSDKENYDGSMDHDDRGERGDNEQDEDGGHSKSGNFSRFENEQYVVDSKTTLMSVSSTGDSITKKLIKTEISSVKVASGIPTPKQYKTTTTITSTVKKSSDGNKSPIVGGALTKATSSIPRMTSK